MSRMAGRSSGRRPCRHFSDEFKEGAVRLVLDEGKTVGAVARELDLTAFALGLWAQLARAERTKGKSGPMKEEREELTRLRKENRELRMARDILKKPRPSSPSTSCNLRNDRRGEGPLRGTRTLSDARRLAERVLGVAHPAGVAPSPGRSTSQSLATRVVHGRSRILRQSAHPRRSVEMGRARQSKPDHSVDPGGRPESSRAGQASLLMPTT